MKVDELLRKTEEAHMRQGRRVFEIGDSVAVHVKIKEGDKERVQVFNGTVIGCKGGGTRESFTVRRLVGGYGVERVFPLHSPVVEKIEVTKRGKIRRAKLYYLRDRVGKATRVTEKRGEELASTDDYLATAAVKPRQAETKPAAEKTAEA
jgi:large subunit ribosomal protein L19